MKTLKCHFTNAVVKKFKRHRQFLMNYKNQKLKHIKYYYKNIVLKRVRETALN